MAVALEKTVFGTTCRGETVERFLLENGQMRVGLLSYGAAIHTLQVPDAQGALVDVALGYETLAGYETRDGYLGAVIGRVSNRIAGGRFSLNGVQVSLSQNEGANHLHGGVRGFDKYVWQGAACPGGVVFSRRSPHGEEGYPGDLDVQVIYRLDRSVLTMETIARSTRDTLCSLTGHTYFDLSGGGDAMGQRLTIYGETVLPQGEGHLPDSVPMAVAGTPFDFRRGKAVGRDIAGDRQVDLCGGYDHHFCLGPSGTLRKAATLQSRERGISMTLSTTLPGLQLYTANGLSRRQGKGGQWYGPHSAVCLEPQFAPNAINAPGQEPPILSAGDVYRHTIVLSFCCI